MDEAAGPGVRAIAYYLPQFHPIPENDRWWGPGFTEWTHVRAARPLFPGHLQPRVPATLGYYDLRDADVRAEQAMLARAAGIHAFCYWHYWFGGGRRILDQVFGEVLASGEPDLPFALCWANESWSGVWYGAPERVLIEQTYPGHADVVAHFEELLPAFRDQRYVRVDGKPLFLVLRPRQHPDLPRFVKTWQSLARQAGLDGIYFAGETHMNEPARVWDPSTLGLDATVDFGLTWFRRHPRDTGAPKLLDYLSGYLRVPRLHPLGAASFPVVVPQWDNTPRTATRGVVLDGATPAYFREQVKHAAALVSSRPEEERILFVRAWNEWGEGNYIEPDVHHGHEWLDALREGLGLTTGWRAGRGGRS